MNQSLEQLVAEFKGSMRLRLGLYALVAMTWGYGLTEWWDRVQAEHTSSIQVQEEADRLAVYEENKQWGKRAEEAEQLRASLTSGFYSGSRSQAQAQLRDALSALATQHKLKTIDLAVQATDIAVTPSQIPGEARSIGASSEPEILRARIVFEFAPKTAAPWLLALSTGDKRLVIDRFIVRNRAAGPNQPAQAEMDLRAFLLPAGPTT